MPQIKHFAKIVGQTSKNGSSINWYPGHMYSGMQAMMGKLNTVDCIVEVHDARIPFTGRNEEFRKHLGLIKPRLLVLNKRDLADLSRWDSIKARLEREGDNNVLLTDLSGSNFSTTTRGYTSLMQKVVNLINQSDRYNRQSVDKYKMMIVGVPNVGKSTLINRLRQHHMGKKGEPATCGAQAGVTKHVENMIKICSRPPIYSLDTPGVLQLGSTKNKDQAMKLALCSLISDRAIDPIELADYLLKLLHKNENYLYKDFFGLEHPAMSLNELVSSAIKGANKSSHEATLNNIVDKPRIDQVCWDFIRKFRMGYYGKYIFD